MEIRNIPIYSVKVARDLIHKEFKIVDIRQNRNYPDKSVYYFEDTIEIRKYLSKEHNIIPK